MLKIKGFVCIFFLFFSLLLFAEENLLDSIQTETKKNYKKSSLIIPSFLIGYGFITLNNDALKEFDKELRKNIRDEFDKEFTIDDYAQYMPMLSVYALNFCGIEGENDFRDRTLVLASSYVFMGASVNILKYTIKRERPDGSANNSFPSGHTATAFMGAEFLWQEYKDVSVWYGITAYVIASGTGFFRMYNNKHWFSDVMTGAGIGIFSTKFAYWLKPYLADKLFSKKNKGKISVAPYYDKKGLSLSCSYEFQEIIKNMNFKKWIKELLKNLDELASENTKKTILEKCGAKCPFSHMSDKKLLQMKNQSKNEKDFLNNLSKLWKVVKENHKYYVIYDKCYCPLVQNNPKSFPESICYCSLGSLKHKFKIAFGRDIKIEMQKTIIKGNKECLFEIKL